MAAAAGKAGLGRRALAGACSLLVCTVFLFGAVECALTLTGVVSAGHGVFEQAARRLGPDHDHDHDHDDDSVGSTSEDGHWSDEDETWEHAEELRLWSSLIQLGVAVGICILECCALFCHWKLFIAPKPNVYVPVRAVVPQDLQGDFKYGLFDCFGDFGTCCCFCWCGPCMIADLWYRSGWLHAALGSSAQRADQGACPGWPWFLGVGGYCFAQDSFPCCMPCAHAVLRGGISFVDGSDGGLGEITPIRKLFGMPHDGFATFFLDTLSWCCCGPCAGTQEYRQIMDLLNRGPVQQAPIAHTQVIGAVVGQPVQVAQVVQVGQPVPEAAAPTNNKGFE